MEHDKYRMRKGMIWGVVLILIGTIFVVDRQDWFDVHSIGSLWPFIIVVFGINELLYYEKPKKICDGLWLIFIGLWVYACNEHLWGFTYGNSWPLFLVVTGVNMMIKAGLKYRRVAQQNKATEAV